MTTRAKKSNDTQKAARYSFLATAHTHHAPSNETTPPKPKLFMAPTTRASTRWATFRVAALPEFWTLVAEHSGLVGAWRLTGVCRASRVGAKAWLRTLKRLLVCGGVVVGGGVGGGFTRAVWRLDLGELRWEQMPDLGGVHSAPACCAVRGNVVVLGGEESDEEDDDEVKIISTVEVLRRDSEAEEHTFTDLPPLACGLRSCAIALLIDENESAEGQVLLLGGFGEHRQVLDLALRVVKVDLATGACTPHPPLLHDRVRSAAARLPDGRVVCAGGSLHPSDPYPAAMMAEVLEPPEQGSPDGLWRWRELPPMSVRRDRAAGCALGDGRFAVFGGEDGDAVKTASCEVLTLDGVERWEPLPPMREARSDFVCVAVGGCVIVAGGYGLTTVVEVYEEALGRWRRLPCSLPHEGGLYCAGSALV
jgi:hypothetical protein